MKTTTAHARRLMQTHLPEDVIVDRPAAEELAGGVDRYVEEVIRRAYQIAQARSEQMLTPSTRIRAGDVQLAAGCVQSADDPLFRFVLGAMDLARAVSDRSITRPELREMAIDFLEMCEESDT